MAKEKYILFVWTLICLNCVFCDLNLNEGEPCIDTNGYNGTCVNVYKCPAAALTYIYANAGYSPRSGSIPDMPDVCSYKNNEPIVCCTECSLSDDNYYRQKIVDFNGRLRDRGSTVASRKCWEYFDRLPYRCRGRGNIKVEKFWNEDEKCHGHSYSVAMGMGGRNADRWEFPHLALLGYGNDVDSAQWLCGGSIISERFILTAGHCISTHYLGTITFAALGLLKRTDPKEYWKIYKTKRIIAHPEYRPPSKYHDIALLETDTEINFGSDILPACLAVGESYDAPPEASGWGRLGNNNQLADTLQVMFLELFSEEECAAIYRPHRLLRSGYNHTTQMCLGSHSRAVDTCEGDSGGPLQFNEDNRRCLFYIVGVTSFGKECGLLGSAGIYTNVHYYMPWIESIVWPEEVAAV